jgi:hypothetical protein
MSNPSTQKPAALHFGVSLFIKGDHLDLDEISRTLGLSQTNISRKGKRYGHAQELCDFDGWYYSPRIESTWLLDEHIMALWDAVRPHVGYLCDLKQKCEVSVSVHVTTSTLWFGREYQTRFEVDHRCMGLFTELGIPCRVFVTITERVKEK